MVGNRTIIPTNFNPWQFIKLSYPVNSYFLSKGHEFVTLSYPANSIFLGRGHEFIITVVHPDGNETNIIAGYNLKNNRRWHKKNNGPRMYGIDHKSEVYKNDTLFFSLVYSRLKPGTYTVSLQVKDFLPPCRNISITIKGLFIISIFKFQTISVLTFFYVKLLK